MTREDNDGKDRVMMAGWVALRVVSMEKARVERLWPLKKAHGTGLVDRQNSRDAMRPLDEAGAEVGPRVVGASICDAIAVVSMRVRHGAVGLAMSFHQHRYQEFVQWGVST